MVVLSEARVVWKLLNGIICVYKPAGVKVPHLRNTIITNLCNDPEIISWIRFFCATHSELAQAFLLVVEFSAFPNCDGVHTCQSGTIPDFSVLDLCELECRPPANHVFIEGDPLKSLTVRVAPSYADHVLVVGPRYQPSDFRCSWAMHLGKDTSGVLVLGLNDGLSLIRRLYMTRPMRAYHIKGLLGQATDTFFTDGEVVEKATYRHVTRNVVDKILATLQAAHQKQMFEQCGVDMESQAAYELAVQGPIRPSSGNLPVVYSIKCIHFSPPHFTLEVQCINEYEMYLKTLVHELGMQVRSAATCTGVQCIRYGHLTLDQALLRRHWRLQHVLTNLLQCKEILAQRGAFRQDSAKLVSKDTRALLENAS